MITNIHYKSVNKKSQLLFQLNLKSHKSPDNSKLYHVSPPEDYKIYSLFLQNLNFSLQPVQFKYLGINYEKDYTSEFKTYASNIPSSPSSQTCKDLLPHTPLHKGHTKTEWLKLHVNFKKLQSFQIFLKMNFTSNDRYKVLTCSFLN